MKFVEIRGSQPQIVGDREVELKLEACLNASNLNLWRIGDPIFSSGVRVLVGVATWVTYDLELLDSINDLFDEKHKQLRSLRVDVCNFDDAFITQVVLDKYVPDLKIEAIFHSPIVGVWESGVFKRNGTGKIGRLIVEDVLNEVRLSDTR